MRRLTVIPNEAANDPDRFEFEGVGKVVLRRLNNLTLQLEVDDCIVHIQGCAGTNSWMRLIKAECGPTVDAGTI